MTHLDAEMSQFFNDLEEMWQTERSEIMAATAANHAVVAAPAANHAVVAAPAVADVAPAPAPAAAVAPVEKLRSPTNPTALFIWGACGFRHKEKLPTILKRLSSWAEENHLINRLQNPDVARFNWTHNGTRMESTWPVFVKWFLCACGYQPSQGPLS